MMLPVAGGIDSFCRLNVVEIEGEVYDERRIDFS